MSYISTGATISATVAPKPTLSTILAPVVKALTPTIATRKPTIRPVYPTLSPAPVPGASLGIRPTIATPIAPQLPTLSTRPSPGASLSTAPGVSVAPAYRPGPGVVLPSFPLESQPGVFIDAAELELEPGQVESKTPWGTIGIVGAAAVAAYLAFAG